MAEHDDGNYYCEEHDDEGIVWFNRKYPHASCHTCDKKLDGASVVMCGGGGGACETWYCSECHNPDGNDDCVVCNDEETDYCNGCDRDVPAATMFNHDDINLCPECNTKKPELIPEGCECERCVKE
jgi:hypothetical protein